MATDDRVSCKAGWGANGEAMVSSAEELDTLLDQLSMQFGGDDAVLVELARPGAGSLSIGVGRDVSVLSYVPDDGLPPYLVSRGEVAEGSGTHYYYYDTWTHFDAADLIAPTLARAVARRFVEHGELGDDVDWREV